MQKIKITFIFTFLFISSLAQAQVSVFKGESNEMLTIQQTPELGKETVLVKFEGVNSPWQNKIIKLNKKKTASNTSYSFNYKLVLSNGSHNREYILLVESGSKFIKGTESKRVELYIQGQKDPVELFHDMDQTALAKKTNFIPEYKKSPYKPQVD